MPEDALKDLDDNVYKQVAEVLARWNPLGTMANTVPDLNGYEIEAADIIGNLEIGIFGSKLDAIIRDTLNQAFGLSLSTKDCAGPAREIALILRKPRTHSR